MQNDQKALIYIFGKLTFWKLTISPIIDLLNKILCSCAPLYTMKNGQLTTKVYLPKSQPEHLMTKGVLVDILAR
jgi:hypothetical protein